MEQLEKKLIQMQENQTYTQELASIGSWSYTIQTGELFITDEVYCILECSPQEFEGKLDSFYLRVHPADLEMVKEATKGALSGKEYDIEYRIVTSAGAVKYVHEKTKAIYDDNNPIKMVGIIQDISNRKKIENNLKFLGDDLNQAQRITGVGSWKYDVIKDEFYGTEEMFHIYGVTPAEFNNDFSNAIKLVHPEDQYKIEDAMEKHLKGLPCQFEFRIPQLNGETKYVVGKGEPIFNHEQRVIGIIGTLQDITEKKLLEERLKISYKSLVEAQRLASIGSWEIDLLNQKVVFCSEEVYKIFGITKGQFDKTHINIMNMIHSDDVEIMKKIYRNPPVEQPVHVEFRVIRPDGSVFYAYNIMEITFDKARKPTYMRGTTQDITEKKNLQKEIEHKQQEINKIQKRFQILVQESNDVFEILASDGTIKYMSKASETVIGFKPEERLGKKVYAYYEGEELQKLHEMMDFVLDKPNKKTQRDVRFRCKNGKEIYLDVNMQNLLHEPTVEGIVVNFRDITKRKEMEQQIIHISTHDELTSIPNRTFFKQKLALQYQCTGKANNRFAVVMLEIDGLKFINDALGYLVGDELIIQVSKSLKQYFGDSIFISRYSGVVFALIVEGKGAIAEYEGLVKEIISLFSQPFKIGKYEISVNINIGVAICNGDELDIGSLLNHVEIALYWAKREGKNKYKFYSSDINIQNYKQFQLRNDLRKAVSSNQLKVFYQPLINLNTNKILAAEALIRWEHPDWGIVSPMEFIPLAEETGEIINIGNWLLNEVCKNYIKWVEQGLPNIKISVNYSSVQFFEESFVNNIKNSIDEYELDPHFLIVEITESILMEKPEKAIADIQNLQSLGIQVALDDFGTGYSSLAYLNSFHIDILKIDGSFVKNIMVDNNCKIILKSIINMAHDLKIKLVAEGIENWQQLSYLKEFKCHTGQGYIYAKPQNLQNFEKILVKGKCRPVVVNDTEVIEERRKYYRLQFYLLLESSLKIMEINGNKVNIGNTSVLVKNMGPGGLCFITNLNLPVDKGLILQFTAYLLGEEIRVHGRPVWAREMEHSLYEYGVEFTFDENKRTELTRVLNMTQVKMKNNILFSDGSFVSESPGVYFK